MVVTSVVPFDKKRSKVWLDEDLALLLYSSEIRRYSLEEGCQVSSETYEEIVNQVLKKRARERVTALLKASDKTELELRRALEKGMYPREVIDDAVGLVKKYGYVDDDAYGQRYAQLQSRQKSKRQIAFELQKKGLDREQISRVLEENPVDEEEQIRRFLRKKGFSEENRITRENYQKTAASLMRKGYHFDTVSKILEEFSDNI